LHDVDKGKLELKDEAGSVTKTHRWSDKDYNPRNGDGCGHGMCEASNLLLVQAFLDKKKAALRKKEAAAQSAAAKEAAKAARGPAATLLATIATIVTATTGTATPTTAPNNDTTTVATAPAAVDAVAPYVCSACFKPLQKCGWVLVDGTRRAVMNRHTPSVKNRQSSSDGNGFCSGEGSEALTGDAAAQAIDAEKTRAESDPQKLLNKRVTKVFEEGTFEGMVLSYSKAEGYAVKYDSDGLVEWFAPRTATKILTVIS
jgi:hypothetical protein